MSSVSVFITILAKKAELENKTKDILQRSQN